MKFNGYTMIKYYTERELEYNEIETPFAAPKEVILDKIINLDKRDIKFKPLLNPQCIIITTRDVSNDTN